MRYATAFTSITDGYRAGATLGEGLQAIAPEVVVVFFSEQYFEHVTEVSQGLRDVLGEQVLCCGGSGDGVYWREGVANHGVVALGIASGGAARWAAALVPGVGASSATAAKEAVEQVRRRLEGEPSFALVLADGCRADGGGLVQGLGESLRCPCFGGLTADARNFIRTSVFLGDEAAQDSVLVLAAHGEVPLRIGAASGWVPVGALANVTSAQGTRVQSINGLPANAFVREQLGKELRPGDLGVVPLAELSEAGEGRYVLRTPSSVDEKTGEMSLFGRVPQGAAVRVCRASMKEIVSGVDLALDEAARAGFTPAAVLIITCAGRRWLLTESGNEEVARVRGRLGDVPLIGLPSFGEIAPFGRPDGSYSPPLFHNVTFVACVLGS